MQEKRNYQSELFSAKQVARDEHIRFSEQTVSISLIGENYSTYPNYNSIKTHEETNCLTTFLTLGVRPNPNRT